jgi:flagellar hook-length control protein FliK
LDETQTPDLRQQDTDGSGDGLQLILGQGHAAGEVAGLTDMDLTALVQILNGTGTLAAADALAALAGRIASGTQTEADTALLQAALAAQNGKTASPEQQILALLTKATGKDGAELGADNKIATATLTVLRRETHLGPTRTAVALDAPNPWVGELAGRGGTFRPGQMQTESLPSRPGDTLVAAIHVGEEGLRGHLDYSRAVSAVSGSARSGTSWQQESWSGSGPQIAFDAPPAANGEQAFAVRSDALNTGLGSGVTQQIAQRIISEAGTLAAETAGRPDAPAIVVKHDSPVKILHIQLQPAELGTVTIRMAVKDGALRLELEAGRSDTAQIIQRDRETLSALLRSAGYLIDGVDVRLTDPSAGAAAAGGNQAGMQMQGGHSGSSQAQAQLPGQRHHEGHRHNPFGSRKDGEDEQGGRSTGRGGVYL